MKPCAGACTTDSSCSHRSNIKLKCKQEPAGKLNAGYMVCKFPNLRIHITVSNTPTQVIVPVLYPAAIFAASHPSRLVAGVLQAQVLCGLEALGKAMWAHCLPNDVERSLVSAACKDQLHCKQKTQSSAACLSFAPPFCRAHIPLGLLYITHRHQSNFRPNA
jgi:hypothetical protein